MAASIVRGQENAFCGYHNTVTDNRAGGWGHLMSGFLMCLCDSAHGKLYFKEVVKKLMGLESPPPEISTTTHTAAGDSSSQSRPSTKAPRPRSSSVNLSDR